jgi:pantothenate kinase
MVKIKGAPVTFDLERLTESIRRVAAGEVCGWPVYDRLLHNPTENALTVSGEIVILEGNYLLLNEAGWSELRNYADYTISVAAEEDFLRERLIDRRIKTGVSPEAAARFVDFSDMPNVRLCLRKTA